MSTEKQRLANQANARKSTGPKTTAGKENSRRNALQHGLSGSGSVLTRDEGRELQKTLEAWRQHLQPIDVLEDRLVARAALASVRLERCVKKDLADVARRMRRATSRWDARQWKHVEGWVEELKTDPANAIEQLETTSVGCRWLIDQWKDLGASLDETGFWNEDQAARATRLRGKDPQTTPLDDPAISKLRIAVLAIAPVLDADAVDAFLEMSTSHLHVDLRVQTLSKWLPDPETARAILREIVQIEVARLEPLTAQLWEEQDGPDRQEAEDVSLVDTTLAGTRALRYETANELSMHRNVNQLVRLRKVETEQQTYTRWSKLGIDQGRRWGGTGWVFLRDEAKAKQREDAARRECERIQEQTPQILAPDQPVRRAEDIVYQEPPPLPLMVARAAAEEDDRQESALTSPQDVARNEPNFSGIDEYLKRVSVDRLPGSPTGNYASPQIARPVGSGVGSPVDSRTLADTQPVGGSLRNEANPPDTNPYWDAVDDDPRTATLKGDIADSEGARPSPDEDGDNRTDRTEDPQRAPARVRNDANPFEPNDGEELAYDDRSPEARTQNGGDPGCLQTGQAEDVESSEGRGRDSTPRRRTSS